MAKALTRRPGRRSKQALFAPGRPPRSALGAKEARERELKRLRLSVCDDVGFRLYLATYDQPRTREELIARVIREAEAEEVRVTRLDLAEANPETNLVGLLRKHVEETDLPPGWRQAVMVTGIEQRLDYAGGREGYAFLHQANLLRDALSDAAPVPVTLWLSRLASAALPTEAPDLWHWRAANFDFTGDEAPRLEVLRDLTTLQPEADVRLSDEQRRKRVGMLQDLLAELERQGRPNTKRQAAERADLLVRLGIEETRLGRTDAISRFERALDLYQEIGDRDSEGDALGNMGIAYRELGKPRRAIELLEEALVIFREVGDRRCEGDALFHLGIACYEGEPRRAIELYEEALVIFREVGDRRRESSTLGNLGLAYMRIGEPRRAIELYEQALMIMREIGDRQNEGKALRILGNAHYALGEPQRAIEDYEQSLAIAREIGERDGEAKALRKLGNAYYGLGEPHRAIEHFEEALAIARGIGDRRGEGNSLYNSALAFDDLGDLAEAVRRMEEALRIYEQIKDPNAERARAQLTVWDWE